MTLGQLPRPVSVRTNTGGTWIDTQGILVHGPVEHAQSKDQVPGLWEYHSHWGETANQWQDWTMTTPTIGGGRYHEDPSPVGGQHHTEDSGGMWGV